MNPIATTEPEWTRFYPARGTSLPDVLHARFIRHADSRHTHDEYVVGIIETGVQRLDLERGVHYSPAGSIVLINPGESHTGGPGLPDGYVYRTFYASESFIRSAAAELGTTSAVLPSFRKTVITDQRLYDVLSAFHRSLGDQAASLQQESHLRHAISLLVRRHTERRSSKWRLAGVTPAVRRARQYLDESYVRDVSLSELAEACGSSPFHLARAFTAHFGLPPHAYLNNVRVTNAKRMIRAGTALAAVAYAVGYCDQSHLNRRFKKIVGVTPSQYARDASSPSAVVRAA
jgi:AraC-like DNA-binding protein